LLLTIIIATGYQYPHKPYCPNSFHISLINESPFFFLFVPASTHWCKLCLNETGVQNNALIYYTLAQLFSLSNLKSSVDTILSIKNLSKSYQGAGRTLTVLHDINFSVEAGSTVSIVGPSGSGKTTLLGLCAGLDRATSGSVELNHVQLDTLNEDQRAQVRNRYVGFIFQNFQLMPTLTALENVMVPLELRGEKNARARSKELLDKVGLADRLHHYPMQLSGGEQQRVSLARAFANNPRILFADEPTGNLDEETSDKVERLLFDLNQEAGTTLIIVTHNLELAAQTNRIIRIKGGTIVSDERKAS
jgi:ABC-type antimicrobial peptide transport system, ATPase component